MNREWEGKSNFLVKKPGRQHLIQIIQVNSRRDKSCEHNVFPDVMRWDRHFASAVLSFKIHYLQFKSYKNIRQTQNEEHSTQPLTSGLENCEEQESSEKLLQTGEPRGPWQLGAVWYTEWDPGIQKGHWWQNCWNPKKVLKKEIEKEGGGENLNCGYRTLCYCLLFFITTTVWWSISRIAQNHKQ